MITLVELAALPSLQLIASLYWCLKWEAWALTEEKRPLIKMDSLLLKLKEEVGIQALH